ncbi:hypothetical protein TNCT_171191 [Trichonephila clavata]|uniref:Uncharacterized protein n=1 Tax=Trichonephila clavata TaxID=2740835 RepID=A0A8X6M6B2_TRICU|nr:hypothetical protein TNCT_171191 [Trichonephila clavata]
MLLGGRNYHNVFRPSSVTTFICQAVFICADNVFMDDNVRVHKELALSTIEALLQMEWPPHSPNLNQYGARSEDAFPFWAILPETLIT